MAPDILSDSHIDQEGISLNCNYPDHFLVDYPIFCVKQWKNLQFSTCYFHKDAKPKNDKVDKRNKTAYWSDSFHVLPNYNYPHKLSD